MVNYHYISICCIINKTLKIVKRCCLLSNINKRGVFLHEALKKNTVKMTPVKTKKHMKSNCFKQMNRI